MTYPAPTVRDEWVIGNLSKAPSWQPACATQRSRHFARYQPEQPIRGQPAIWEDDVRGDGGTPLTGARREYRG